VRGRPVGGFCLRCAPVLWVGVCCLLITGRR
jgi:hypothetical protein